jgi:hypothetical protein
MVHGNLFIDASCTTCDDPTTSTTMSNTKKSSNTKNPLRKKRGHAILITGEAFLLQSSSSPLLMSSWQTSYHTYKSSYSKHYTSTIRSCLSPINSIVIEEYYTAFITSIGDIDIISNTNISYLPLNIFVFIVFICYALQLVFCQL